MRLVCLTHALFKCIYIHNRYLKKKAQHVVDQRAASVNQYVADDIADAAGLYNTCSI